MSAIQNPLSLNAALAQVAADIAALPAVTTATVDQIAALQTDVSLALTIAEQAQAFFDAQMGKVGAPGNFAAGIDPDVMIANVGALLQCVQGLNYAIGVSDSLGRLAVNIQSIQN